MAIINIRPVKSGQSKALIAIAGQSGTGKTYTALCIARGMVDKPSEIGFLDTENKRGSLYADILDGAFMIGDLYAPFSPDRYSEAIKEFQELGVKVLVIDSISHEYEGEGGIEDIANRPLLEGKKMANWIGGKREHKRFMNTLLQADMHIICCIRAREKTDFKNPTMPVSLGIQPICEKNFMFEMTASFMMYNEGKNQQFLKLPSYLKDTFGDGNSYLGIHTGKKIREWLDKGEKESPDIEKIKSEALMVCEKGVQALNELWNTLTTDQQGKLKMHFTICKESAIAYEKQAQDASIDNSKPTQEDQEQLRITNFLNECKDISLLAQFDSIELNEENTALLKSTKIKLLKDEATKV